MTAATRFLLCRLGCVVLCLVPTTLVAAWTCWRSTGRFAVAQRHEWQRELTARLGLVVEIESVSYPSLGLARLENLKLFDPESRELLAAAAEVEIAATSGGWQIELWQPQVQAAGLPRLWQTLDERILRGPAGSPSDCTLAARELTIVHGPAAQSLVTLSARYAMQPTGPEIACEFRLPDAAMDAPPMRVALSRNRQQTPPQVRWQLDTAGQSLPCELAADVLPEISRLGKSCRFAGALTLVNTLVGWSGEVAGRLAPLDLDALVSEQFPHHLSGQATLDLERAALDGSRLTDLRGTLRAQHGALSPSLLAAAHEHLQLAADSRFAADSAAPIPYQQLAIRFHLNDRSLTLAGDADPTQPGVLISAAVGPILSALPQHSVAAVNLLRTLLPGSEFQVPAARQTSALVNLLPIPDATVPATAHTPIRLAPTTAAEPARAVRQPMMR